MSDSLVEDHFTSAFIVADGATIEVLADGGLLGMAVQLLCCYYSWCLNYPKPFQILGFLQEYVLKDTDNVFHKSTNFKNFEKLYDIAVNA